MVAELNGPKDHLQAKKKTPPEIVRTIGQIRQKIAESVGGAEVWFATEDGTPFWVDQPALRPAEVSDQLKDLDDEDDIARVVLGDQWDDFVAHGGRGSDLGIVMIAASIGFRDFLANGRPTRSSTSSESTPKT